MEATWFQANSILAFNEFMSSLAFNLFHRGYFGDTFGSLEPRAASLEG